MDRRHPGSWVMIISLVILVIFSSYLALNRIYQVDECQNLFMARVIGTGQTERYFTSATLWLMGPLAWLAGKAKNSADLFSWGRLIFCGIFWLNIFLIGRATGVRLRSAQGLFILFMAATLAPLWDYGFEIRHDNVILAGLLLIWCVGRTSPRGNLSYLTIGFLTVALPFVAFKSFVYTIPLSAVFLLFPPPEHKQKREKLIVSWFAGALIAFVFCFLLYRFSGLWSVYLSGLKGGLESSSSNRLFNPWITLSRTVTQTPLLLAATAWAFWSLAHTLRHGLAKAFQWENHLPEGILVLICLAALFINPTPFPYNLVNMVPFAFIFSCRFLRERFAPRIKKLRVGGLIFGLVLVAHLLPFVVATWRHVGWTNGRQKLLMNAAEALTDPVKDRVYDAIGMLPTRQSIHYYWYLHSLNMQSFTGSERPTVLQMLQASPPAVFIASYRTDWLTDADWRFIHQRYVPLSDDFWILGRILPAGGGRFDVIHEGRYEILGFKGGISQPLKSVEIDNRVITSSIVELDRGWHEMKCSFGVNPRVAWIGPVLKHLPVIGRGDHSRLFVNWY
jgi:hypothetical protein